MNGPCVHFFNVLTYDTINTGDNMQKTIIGIDVGGTHIDGVVFKDGKIQKFMKKPYLKKNLQTSIHTLVDALTQDFKDDALQIQLSTTLSTNTIAEKTGQKTSLLLEPGPGMVYQFDHLDADIHYLDSYVDHQGNVIKDVDVEKLTSLKASLKRNETLGIVGKFSTRNPSHEQIMNDMFKEDFQFLTQGHTLSGKLNYPRRVETTFLNNYVVQNFKPFAKGFLDKYKDVHILKADAGTMPLKEAMDKPVETILSGPAASFMGIKAMLDQKGDGLLFDIGGTTTDVFFIVDGEPLFEPKGIQIESYKTLVRSIYSFSLPLGGDSRILYDEEISFGKRTGFALGFGGEDLTLSDALIALELMEAPHKDKVIDAFKMLSDDVQAFAKKVVDTFVKEIYEVVKHQLEIINSKPVYTIREVLEDRQIKPEFIQVIGGPANALSKVIHKQFKIPVEVPYAYSYANALGAALSRQTKHITILANTRSGKVIAPEANYEASISKHYSLKDAIELAQALLEEKDIDILEAQSFNMVSYGYGADKNIRVEAQIKPGLHSMLKEKSYVST